MANYPWNIIARMECADGTDIKVHCTMPFVPVRGHTIAVTPAGDYLDVVYVCWHIDRPNELEVFVESGVGHKSLSYWLDQGWVEPTKESP